MRRMMVVGKVRLANILSRDLGGDPQKYVQCLDQMFAAGANATLTIRGPPSSAARGSSTRTAPGGQAGGRGQGRGP